MCLTGGDEPNRQPAETVRAQAVWPVHRALSNGIDILIGQAVSIASGMALALIGQKGGWDHGEGAASV